MHPAVIGRRDQRAYRLPPAERLTESSLTVAHPTGRQIGSCGRPISCKIGLRESQCFLSTCSRKATFLFTSNCATSFVPWYMRATFAPVTVFQGTKLVA